MSEVDKLRKAYETGKICGITDTNGTKYNGQVTAVGQVTVLVHDRNKRQNVALRHNEIDSVRCG
jgi:sRNA-binding regulator protein Hfq